MSDPALGLTMLVLIVVVIMMGFPTAFTLMGLGMMFGFIAFYDPSQSWTQNRVFDLMVERTYGAMNNESLISIPLFVLMGYVMERGALVDKMFYSIQLAFRRVPASLAVATLIVCTFWGIASGLVGAVVVLMGVIAIDPMLKAGLRHAPRLGRDHRRRHAGHPDSAVGDDHRVRGRGRAVGGEALRVGDVPGLLPRRSCTSSTSSAGRSSIRRSRPSSTTDVPVPAWIAHVPGAYRRNMLVALLARRCCRRRARARSQVDGRAAQLSGDCVRNFLSRLSSRCCSRPSRCWGIWWYVVIHQLDDVER